MINFTDFILPAIVAIIIIFGAILFMYTSIIESLLRIMIGLRMVYNSLIKLPSIL